MLFVQFPQSTLRLVEYHLVAASELGVCTEIITAPEWQVTYDTDALGRRTHRTATGEPDTYLLYHDSLNPVALLDTNGDLLQRYVYLPDSHTPVAMLQYTPGTSDDPTAWVYVADSRGSVRLVVNALTGEIGQRMDYGPWGEVIDDTNPGFQPFGYAGGEYDPRTGLTRFGARDYDSEVGRWTARDPIGFGGGDTNLYAYVGGDPVNSVDVTGLEVYHCWYAMDGWLSSFNHHMICTDSYPSQSGCMGYGPNQTTLEPDLRRGSNQAAIRCRSLPDVDEMCANEKMRTNNYGFYFPFTNDCFDAVERVINQCDSSAFRWTDGWEIPIGAWDW